MAIQFGPKLPKGNLVQGQPIPIPNTPINNESKPDTPTTQEHKGSIEEVENGKPGDFTIVVDGEERGKSGNKCCFRFYVYYKNNDGITMGHELNGLELSRLNRQDSYFGPDNK